MRRLPDWEQRLSDYIEAHRRPEFEPGKLDCVLWAAGAVKATTGVDLARGHRGTYKGLPGIARKLRKMGVADAAGVVDLYLPLKPVRLAQRGDIVLTADGNLAVLYAGTAFAVGEDEYGEPALVRVPMEEWKRAWAVG